MSFVHRFVSGVRALVSKTRAERDLDEELRAYLDAAIGQKIGSGMTRDAAERAARAEMGSVAAIKENVRETAWETRLDTFFGDMRFAVRALSRSPGATAVIAITMALAIGACTVVFSIVNTIVLHPLDGSDTDRVVLIRPKGYAGFGPINANGRHFDEWLSHASSFDALYGFTGAFTTTSTPRGTPFRTGTRWVKGDFLRVIGVTPIRGRGFLPVEFTPGAPKVVLIKHRVWKRAFPELADPVGQTLLMNEEPHTIVGVLPPSADDADTFASSQIDMWAPLVVTDPTRPPGLGSEGRIKTGVSLAAAQDEINRLAAAVPGTLPPGADRSPYIVLNKAEFVASKSARVLWSLFGAVGCVLLIACANIANLTLARATKRQRELAVRAALGAGRSRIIRLLIIESIVLALTGGALGVAASYGALAFVRDSNMATAGTVGENGTGLYRLPYVEIDLEVLAFALGATLAAGLLCGIAPALFSSRRDPNDVLKEGGRGSSDGRGVGRVRSAFVIAEVALAAVVLAGTGIFVRSFLAVTAVDPGYDTRRAVTFNYILPRQQYAAAESRLRFADRLRERLHAIAGVHAVAFGNLPIQHDAPSLPYEIEGKPLPEHARPVCATFAGSPEYFDAVGVSLLRGRTFTPGDPTAGAGPRLVVVNATLARRHFPEGDAVGKRLMIGRQDRVVAEIIGVVGDVRQNGPERAVADQIYFPIVPGGYRHVVIVRGQSDAKSLVASVKNEARRVEPNIVIADDAPLQTVVDNQIAQRRFIVQLLTIFSAVALVIAVVGIYALIAYNVAQRTAEIGLRMALGAGKRDVLGMVLRQGANLVGAGLVVGLIIALAAGRLVEAMLFQTSARDPVALTAVAVLFSIVAAVACWLPAYRASNVDPMVALRAK
jgi:predicted permease